MGEFANKRIDLTQRERRGGVAFDIAPHKPVVGELELEGGRTGGVDDDGAVLLDEAEDPEDAAHPEFALTVVDRDAERADVRAGARRAREQCHRRGRGARRPIIGMHYMAPARDRPAVLAQQASGGRLEQPDVGGVPLDRDLATEPARRRAVVGVLDLDAAIEVHRAGAELVVAKRVDRQREQRRPLFGEHGRDLALGGAVDARIGPASVPAIEIHLSVLQPLEAQPREGGLRVSDGRLHLALAIGIANATGQRDDAVVREQIAIERVEGGIVNVRREHALAQVVENDNLHGAAQAAKRFFV